MYQTVHFNKVKKRPLLLRYRRCNLNLGSSESYTVTGNYYATVIKSELNYINDIVPPPYFDRRYIYDFIAVIYLYQWGLF